MISKMEGNDADIVYDDVLTGGVEEVDEEGGGVEAEEEVVDVEREGEEDAEGEVEEEGEEEVVVVEEEVGEEEEEEDVEEISLWVVEVLVGLGPMHVTPLFLQNQKKKANAKKKKIETIYKKKKIWLSILQDE